LKAAGATGVFFLPTDFIGTDRIPWWDEIAWLVRHSKRPTLSLVGLSDPLSCDEPEQTINTVLRLVKSRSHLRMSAQLEEIRVACGLNGEHSGARQRLFMNWDEAIEVRRAGMDIGSHTHTHELLSHLCANRQEQEMRESKSILESRLGEPVHAIAYPVGTREAFTQETCEIARRIGYRVGFSFIGHANPLPLADAMCIGRLAVEDDVKASVLMTLTCFPRIS
jgi:peptidoglycan/xylan/chitin deacetylase (PgdA/CDA1 family)